MNKERKAAVVEEVAAQIEAAEAVFAVDYRGISVPQAAQLRQRLTEAGASFRVVKNTLTERAADRAGADDLKGLLEGPTAFTFVTAEDGDVALAAKALAQFRREHAVLEFKGGRMNGEPLSVDQIESIARLPAREVLHGQLAGVVASPITGLVRGLNQLIQGLAMQLGQIAEQGLVGDGAAEPAGATAEATAQQPSEASDEDEAQAPEASEQEAPAPEEASQQAEQSAQQEEAGGEAAESAGEGEGGEPSTEGEQEQETDAPSEGDEKEG